MKAGIQYGISGIGGQRAGGCAISEGGAVAADLARFHFGGLRGSFDCSCGLLGVGRFGCGGDRLRDDAGWQRDSEPESQKEGPRVRCRPREAGSFAG